MKKIEKGDEVVLISDVNLDSPFFASTGAHFEALDVGLDPNLPSGYFIKIQGYGIPILIDKSIAIHKDDWKRIYNAVLEDVSLKARL